MTQTPYAENDPSMDPDRDVVFDEASPLVAEEQPLVPEQAPAELDVSVYWGPVHAALAKSQADGTEITITSDDGVESRGAVDVIAEDWVAIKGKAGLKGTDTHFWLARAHITRVIDPLND